VTRVRRGALIVIAIVAAAGAWWWTQARYGSGPAATDLQAPVSPPIPPVPEPGAVVMPLPLPERPAPPAAAAPAPPRPPVPAAVLRLPFGVGEVATYDVSWMGLSAGTVEFTVQAGGAPGAAFRFELTASTSPLVSAFFEARDRFWTVATHDLFPLEHGQELQEGRRHVRRLAVFDRGARLVRVGDGVLAGASDGISYALPPSARDPLAAMYYVRSRDWDREPDMRLLVSDLGADLGVELRSGPTERVTAEGLPQLARRMAVRMEYVAAKVPAPRATVWLSTDDRRIPLLTEVETEYGVFRMALTRYAASSGAPAASRPR
jgi:hypothetical protein